jgi:hypothetical protein
MEASELKLRTGGPPSGGIASSRSVNWSAALNLLETISRENCSASRTAARGDARPPGVVGVERVEDEYSLPDEALAFSVGSSVAERSREND